ncbi:hypothetical protein V1478_010103 [Vespula squamosa]|uniref:Secreted protein n=1 Tax=Vespula squamosa TaxID=30214 RepID=A0ABD2AIR8_VESSQ
MVIIHLTIFRLVWFSSISADAVTTLRGCGGGGERTEETIASPVINDTPGCLEPFLQNRDSKRSSNA